MQYLADRHFLCCDSLTITAKLTLKGISFNIQNFDCCLERFNIYLLEIAKQFLICYNKLIIDILKDETK